MIRVFGDIALDVWLWGEPTRLAQEAPTVPVISMARPPEISLGCAGNVASVLAANGIQTQLVGRVGRGYWGSVARELMDSLGIDHQCTVIDDGGPTTLKIRGGYVEDGRQIVTGRWDLDRTSGPLPDVSGTVSMMPGWKGIDALIISDYAKDVIERDARTLEGVPSIPVIADIKWRPTKRPLPLAVWYALPNAAEFTDRYGRRPGAPLARREVKTFTSSMAEGLTHGVVVTRGREGALYYDADAPSDIVCPQRVLPSNGGTGYYPCGAGDVFTARFTVEVLAGGNIKRATEAAVDAATVAATTGVIEWEKAA